MFANRNPARILRPLTGAQREWLVISPAQELYSDTALAQINDEFMQPIVAHMNASRRLPHPLRYGGCYTGVRSTDIKGRVGQSLQSLQAQLADPGCPFIGIILMPFAFPPDCVFVDFFKRAPIPLIQFDTTHDKAVPWQEFTLSRLNTQQVGHAGPTLHNAAHKAERRIAHVAGYWGDDAVLDELGRIMAEEARASDSTCLIRSLVMDKLPGSRCGCIGGTMNNVGCTTADRGAVAAWTGVIIEDIPTRELVKILESVSAKDAEPIVQAWREKYDWSRVGSDPDKIAAILYQARLASALNRLAEDRGLNALTTNFESLDELEQLPSLSIQDGSFPWGPEGEALGAILELMLFALIKGVPGAWLTIAEPYRFCYETGIDVLLHMTEVRSQCAGAGVRPQLDASVMPIGGRTKLTARAVHWAEPGPALLINVAHQRSHPAIVVEPIDIVEPPVKNDKQEMAAVACKHRIGYQSALRQWYQSRANHHPRAVKGLTVTDVSRLTAALGWELIVVE